MTNHFLSPSHSKTYGKKPWYTCNKTSLWQTNFPSPLALYYVKVPMYWRGTQRMLQVTFDKLLDSPFNLPCTYVCASKLKRECDIGSGVLSWKCLDGGCCVVVNNCFIIIGLNLSFATTCRKPFCFKKPARLDWFKAEGSSRKSNQRCNKRRQ